MDRFAHRSSHRRSTHRIAAIASGVLLASGLLSGIAACSGGAQTGPYQDTPSPIPTISDLPTPSPVPTTVDDSGTRYG